MPEMLFRRRRLPHQDVDGHPIFITACLEGSLSAAGMSRIAKYRDELELRPRPAEMQPADWEHHKQKLLFAFVDRLLDCDSAVRHLEDSAQAEIVQNAFLHFANERYKLFAFVVMPSHHHWLFLPDEGWSLRAVQESRGKDGKQKSPREIISHSIQSYTATWCNRVRGESGQYWQHETFDHWARDEAEMLRIIEYIEMNPVRAGLAATPEDYNWSSARIRKRLGLKPGQAIPKVT
jgi:type I restriction enzyme R subunit